MWYGSDNNTDVTLGVCHNLIQCISVFHRLAMFVGIESKQ